MRKSKKKSWTASRTTWKLLADHNLGTTSLENKRTFYLKRRFWNSYSYFIKFLWSSTYLMFIKWPHLLLNDYHHLTLPQPLLFVVVIFPSSLISFLCSFCIFRALSLFWDSSSFLCWVLSLHFNLLHFRLRYLFLNTSHPFSFVFNSIMEKC